MTMRHALALVSLALALAAPAHAQIYPGYGTPTLLGDGTAVAPAYAFASSQGTGVYQPSAGQLGIATAGAFAGKWGAFGVQIPAAGAFQWSNVSTDSGSTDLALYRDAANTLAQRNGATGQTFRIYNTFTDASNYERVSLGWSGNVATLKAEAAGTGTVRPLIATFGVGTSTATYTPSGVLFLEANNVTQSSVSQTLHGYTVPANTMTVNGKTLRVTALFLSVNNANAKAIGFTICGGSLTFNATASIAGALRATAYITRTAANTWTTSVTIEEGLASGTLTQAKLSGTYNSTPSCTDTATNTVNATVNTAGATDTSSGFFMVELLN